MSTHLNGSRLLWIRSFKTVSWSCHLRQGSAKIQAHFPQQGFHGHDRVTETRMHGRAYEAKRNIETYEPRRSTPKIGNRERACADEGVLNAEWCPKLKENGTKNSWRVRMGNCLKQKGRGVRISDFEFLRVIRVLSFQAVAAC